MNLIKVKTALRERFKNNRLSIVLGLTIASIFLLILVKVLISGGAETLEGIAEKLKNTVVRDKTETVVVNPNARPGITLEEAKKRIQLGNAKARQTISQRVAYQIQQERLVRDYKEKIHLEMNLPKHLHYHVVDMEDDVGALVGTTTNLDETFAVLATSRSVTPQAVIDYLAEERESLPMLKGHEFLPQKSFSFDPPKDTGLATLTVIPANEFRGRGLYGVLAPRADGRGNYFFMMEAKSSYFERNEDGFEKLLDGMKTKP